MSLFTKGREIPGHRGRRDRGGHCGLFSPRNFSGPALSLIIVVERLYRHSNSRQHRRKNNHSKLETNLNMGRTRIDSIGVVDLETTKESAAAAR
jgi:hypothetical protein